MPDLRCLAIVTPLALLLLTAIPIGSATAQEPVMRRASPEELNPGSTAVRDGRVVAPLLRAGHLPAVEVMINGEGPFLLAVDTGSAGLLHLNAAFAEAHGMPVVGEMTVRDGMTGQDVPMQLVDAGVLEIGGARFDGVRSSTHDFTSIINALGGEMVGIIGFNLFADCLLTIDYPGDRLVIEQGAALPAQGKGIVPLLGGGLFADIEFELDGQTHRTHIDTGSRGGVTIARDLFDACEFSSKPTVFGQGRVVTSSFNILQGEMKGTLSIAGNTVRNPTVQTTDIMDHCNIGVDFLSHIALTFDQRNLRMRFDRPEGAGPITLKPEPKRLGIKPSIRGDLVVLEEVIPGSAAEEAGLRVGDRITAVNGKPIEGLGMAGLAKEMGVRPTVVITVEREGEELTFSVTLE